MYLSQVGRGGYRLRRGFRTRVEAVVNLRALESAECDSKCPSRVLRVRLVSHHPDLSLFLYIELNNL